MKYSLMILGLFISLDALAQVEKGASYVAGYVSGSRSKIHEPDTAYAPDYKDRYFNGQLEYGYLLTDNWAVGLSIGYSAFYIRHKKASESHSGSIYIRRYFPVVRNLYLHLDGSLGYGRFFQDDQIQRHGANYEVAIVAGATYFLSDRVAFTAQLGSITFTRTKAYENGTIGNTNTFGGNFSLSQISIGVAVYFPGRYRSQLN